MYEPIKGLGQNFLTDVAVAQRMVENLEVSAGDEIIEIGPGLGVLTEVLARLAEQINYHLYAVEKDERFFEKLNDMFARQPSIHIVNEDVLKFLPQFESTGEFKIIGSLPFYITSPIIHSIIKMKTRPSKVVIMIQREVAQKIVQFPPDASYMSVFVQTFFDVQYLETVPKGKFRPVPEVDAGILSLTRRKTSVEMDLTLIEKYEGFLHRGFAKPRKMLNKAFSNQELESVGLKPTLRPQNVDVDTWFELFTKYAR